MMDSKIMLKNRAELLICKCRKELFFGKLGELKKKCNKERDDVLRVEGSIFSKLRKGYEDRLTKEREEAELANLELKLAEKEIAELDERIFVFERKMEGVSSIYNMEEMDGAEKELHNWCDIMEKGWDAFSFLHGWMEEAQAERMRVYSNPADREKNKRMHEDIELFFSKLNIFLSMVGRVRYLPGIRVNNGFRTNRTTVMGGKTLIFFCKGYGTFQLDIHEFYLEDMESGWATGDALERKLKELEHLEKLCRSIIVEKLSEGEGLLRKVKMNSYQMSEKDLFGFEKR